MPSIHSYSPGELPSMYLPWGYEYLRDRLLLIGRTNPLVYGDASAPGNVVLSVDEANVSKNQLAFECEPPTGRLAVDQASFNVTPMGTHAVRVSGPEGEVVKVRFAGVGFVSETEFTIPEGTGGYSFMFGACPSGQRVVTPQIFDFYVEDGSCSPVAVLVTFS